MGKVIAMNSDNGDRMPDCQWFEEVLSLGRDLTDEELVRFEEHVKVCSTHRQEIEESQRVVDDVVFGIRLAVAESVLEESDETEILGVLRQTVAWAKECLRSSQTFAGEACEQLVAKLDELAATSPAMTVIPAPSVGGGDGGPLCGVDVDVGRFTMKVRSEADGALCSFRITGGPKGTTVSLRREEAGCAVDDAGEGVRLSLDQLLTIDPGSLVLDVVRR